MKKADIAQLKQVYEALLDCESIMLERILKYREYNIADHIAYALTEIEDTGLIKLSMKKKKVKK